MSGESWTYAANEPESVEPELSEEDTRQAKALAKARLKYGKERKTAPRWMRDRRHGR